MAVRLSTPEELPEGFAYQPEFLSRDEESALLETMAHLEFRAFEFQGYAAKRRVVSYGFEYDFSSRRVSSAAPLPEFLGGLRDKAAAWARVAADDIREAIVIEYPPGAPIGWHRDVPQFELVLGVSLGAACRMRFKPYREKGSVQSILLEPRSIYALGGSVRWDFQHSIAPVEALRYSITFRTLSAKHSRPDAREESVQ
jgi:alkylated DNA repair dioxygenase AlkB